MGSKTLVVFKVFPEEPDDVALVEDGLRKVSSGELKALKREPIGFGLEAVKVGYVIPDKVDGAMEKLEEEVKAVKGASQVEVVATTLL